MTDNKLKEEDIRVGNIIWYHGSTSTFSWDCPAEICQVNHDKRTFKVKSLDDMKEQSQDYPFDTDIYSSDSRLNMRIPDPGEVRWFLNTRSHSLGQEISILQERLRLKEAEAKRFMDYLSRVPLEKV